MMYPVTQVDTADPEGPQCHRDSWHSKNYVTQRTLNLNHITAHLTVMVAL
jgi:hypothetical protein